MRRNLIDRGSGPVVLLVHGFPLDRRMWSAQIDALAERYRVLAPDLRGFGANTSEQALPHSLTMDGHADDLAALLDGLGVAEPIFFCGLSMGGYIGWRFLDRYPERLRGMVFCDTRAAADAPEALAGRLKMAESVGQTGLAPVADGMVPKLLAPRTLAERPEIVVEVRGWILDQSPQTVAAAQRGMAARPDSRGLAAQTRLPCLIIVGEYDAITPQAEAKELVATMARAELAIIPDAGHLSPVENPADFQRALRQFLDRN